MGAHKSTTNDPNPLRQLFMYIIIFFAKTLGFVDTKLLDKFCYSIAVEIFVLIDCNNLFIGRIDYYIVHMYFIVQTEGVWWKNCRPKMLL